MGFESALARKQLRQQARPVFTRSNLGKTRKAHKDFSKWLTKLGFVLTAWLDWGFSESRQRALWTKKHDRLVVAHYARMERDPKYAAKVALRIRNQERSAAGQVAARERLQARDAHAAWLAEMRRTSDAWLDRLRVG